MRLTIVPSVAFIATFAAYLIGGFEAELGFAAGWILCLVLHG